MGITLMNRRTFNQLLAMSAAAAAAPVLPVWAQAKKRSVVDRTYRHHMAGSHRGCQRHTAAASRSGAQRNDLQGRFRARVRRSRVVRLADQRTRDPRSAFRIRWRSTRLPLVSSYTSINLTDPAQRAGTIAAAVAVGKIMKKYGGKTIVIGPSGRVGGESYNFNDHKQNIITTLNELGKAITDIGLIAALHQHTGTAVETRDETYATMEAVDTRYVKFGPDIGQLQKGGVDPFAVVKTFLPVVQHLHFKDWVGGPSMAGYCPLGLGKVNLVAILDLMEGRTLEGMIMVELDGGGQMPYTPRETAQIAHDWLVKNGVTMKA